ncbi:hypothetical protein [Nesterenkonia sp. HG001]|uniref:hypothetical protein n=1 Tax=Nesterenkonia sp. HG001 TaxID=2983207 RepID=UPI002AC3F634|nr:hypothetical protein [Nesterenkonia sp. HG001]MDZ5079139.1 hypothetical protein [Nesterenkonia sp. HG001]
MELTHTILILAHLLGLAVLIGSPLGALPGAGGTHRPTLAVGLRRLLLSAATLQLLTGLALTALLEIDDAASVDHTKIAVKLGLLLVAGGLAAHLNRRPGQPHVRLWFLSLISAGTAAIAVLW